MLLTRLNKDNAYVKSIKMYEGEFTPTHTLTHTTKNAHNKF
jgi:hypothetical protein